MASQPTPPKPQTYPIVPWGLILGGGRLTSNNHDDLQPALKNHDFIHLLFLLVWDVIQI